MVKNLQKIIFFIEPNEDAWITPIKVKNLFMNRFSIDENVGFEILKVIELEKASKIMSHPGTVRYKISAQERKQKGNDLKVKVHFLTIPSI